MSACKNREGGRVVSGTVLAAALTAVLCGVYALLVKNGKCSQEQADIVNSYPADIGSINGYSAINVHPWTVGPDDLAYFIGCLGDNVEIISADSMIAALTENIPHKYAVPEKG